MYIWKNYNFQCDPTRLDKCRSSSSPRCASFVSFCHIRIHQRLDFFCIFVFDQGVTVVVALRMSLATALRASIIITPARFCADSPVASLFLSDFEQPKFVDVESVVADDRISSSPSGARTASCSSRAQTAPAILLTLRDSIAHSAHIEKSQNEIDFTRTKRLKTFLFTLWSSHCFM